MPTRATLYNRRHDVVAMRALIPLECPITVYDARGVFHVATISPTRVLMRGRRQAVKAFVEGYAHGWRARGAIKSR